MIRHRLLRPGRRERECAGQQQCPQDSCGRHERALFHIPRSFGPAIGSAVASTEIGAESREELSVEETEKADIMPRPTTMPEGVSTGEPLLDDVSALLRAWTDGDQRALARLTPMVYDELHRLAHYFLKREQAGHSLQTTALVNEALCLISWRQRRRPCAASSSITRGGAMPSGARTPSMSRSMPRLLSAPIAPMISGPWTMP